jgi:hypothetical protein
LGQRERFSVQRSGELRALRVLARRREEETAVRVLPLHRLPVLPQPATEQRRLPRLVLKAATWKSGELRMPLRDPFEQL